MKYLLIILLAFSFTAGCSNNMDDSGSAPVDNNTEKKDETINKDQPDQKSKRNNQYVDNPQAPDTRSLNEIGQTFEDEDGVVTLEAISAHDNTHLIGPVELTVKDIKVMNYSPSPDLIDYFHGFTHNEENFNYVKIDVTIRNTSEKAINFAPISYLETNQGEKKGFKDDFYLESLYGDLSPNEEKTGELGFVLDKTNIKDLNSITITTSDVFGKEKNSLHKGQKINIEF
ncbi:DUF4352 domain-containing protein [Pseudalkalibacillus caeni]|uniref:DUF4352 domain-containing protein n=1 Tax=Exobacillus caeni TaxID=2574798 RepID=A0A5R9EZ40_9BACL|nr:DUF4352 domain-containing protein [Pseudalkalibacillus caeni]TLS36101.1 DUF4352 domain-containing protein [Pseudalkalibacillus caeni]